MSTARWRRAWPILTGRPPAASPSLTGCVSTDPSLAVTTPMSWTCISVRRPLAGPHNGGTGSGTRAWPLLMVVSEECREPADGVVQHLHRGQEHQPQVI